MHITLKYSDNGGTIWNHYVTFDFTSNFFNSGNYLNLEFLYNNAFNQKKLFAVFPIEGNTGQTAMALLSCNADTLNPIPVLNKFSWSSDSVHTYHSSKMTSDNVNYPEIPYLYFCSAEINQSFHNTLRTAVCTNPFSQSPALTLNPNNFVSVRNGFFYDEFDICYYRNGSDSLILVLQSQADKRILEVYRNGISEMFLGQSSLTGNINVVNKAQYFPKVASDGGKNIMIVSYFDYTATDQDVISYSSSSGAIGPFTMQYISTSTDVEQYPQVTGKYYSNGSFYCSAKRSNTGAGTGSILYRSATHNSWNSYYQLQNDSLAGYSAYDSRPGFRFVNNDSCFAVWSGSGVLYSSAGCNGSGSYVFTKNLQLRVLMEGPYLPASNRMLRGDTLRVYVRNTSSPYNIVDSAKGAIDTGGTGYFSFANVNNNVNYFIVVKSRNTIETWSKPGGEKFINNILNFDFTPSNIQAFGGNEKRIDSSPFSYGVFSGDVNQDGIIDLSDILKIYDDGISFVSGYVATDLNADNFTDLSDLIIAYNNSSNFVMLVRP